MMEFSRAIQGRRHLPLILTCGLALLLRLSWMHFGVSCIHTEGAEYARIAENLVNGKGYVGIATPGTELWFPPLFPLLIALVSVVTRDYFIGGQVVCVAMGSLLVVPVFKISQMLYGERVAIVAALMTALHPLLIGISGNVLSEGPYLTLLMFGTYFCLRMLKAPATRDFGMAGAFFGLAYLVRPEALLFPFLIAGLSGLVLRNRTSGVLSRVGLLLISFLVVAAPYIVFLSVETGQLRVQGKSEINYAWGKVGGFADPALGDQEGFGINADLSPRGIWMRSNLSVIRETKINYADALHYAARSLRRNVPYFSKTIAGAGFLGSPPLFAFVIIGLFRRRWTPFLATGQAVLASTILVPLIGLLFIMTDLPDRYFFVFLPALIIWASKGLMEFSSWLGGTVRTLKRSAGTTGWRLAAQCAGAAAILILALQGAWYIYDIQAFGPDAKYIIDAANLIRHTGSEPMTVMDTSTNIAFHAGARYIPFPEASPDLTLKFIKSRNVNFVVLRESDKSMRGQTFQDWLAHGIPDPAFHLVYRKKVMGSQKVLIYMVR